MWIKREWPVLLLYPLGIAFAHHPMLLSGLARVQVDHEDPRFINYLLEHTYQWLRGSPLHRDFWSPPFFHPAREVLAYSDTLLTAGPWYWPWRMAGLPADTAFQLWLLTCSSLNFFAGLLLLRGALRLGALPSALGAFLYAFGAPRVVEIAHPQMLTHFYSVIAIVALLLAFDGAGRGWRGSALWVVASLAIVAQFYAAFYLGWFFILAAGVALGWGLYDGGGRRLAAVIRRDAAGIAIAAILGGALLRPMAEHYLSMSRVLGPRTLAEVRYGVPKLLSWAYMGPDSWLYAWLTRHPLFWNFGTREPVHRIGVGWVTTIACLAGLYLGRRDPVTRNLGLAGLSLFVISTSIPYPAIQGLMIVEWALCAVVVVRSGGRPGMRALALALFGLLAWAAFPALSIALVGEVVVVVLAAGETVLRRYRRPLYLATAAACALFLIGNTFMDRPSALIVPALGLPALRAINRGSLPRPAPLDLAALVLATAAALLFHPGGLFLWRHVYELVPAGGAIRVTSRVSLLLLIPLAIGFARSCDWLAGRAGWRYAAPLAAFCLLEQGLSTPTFDKREARARVEAVASWVESLGRPRCFYYSSHRPGLPDWNDHVDAMWAGIASGVPTLNGYSSSVPPGWWPLFEAAIRAPFEEERQRASLLTWARERGIPPEEIAWIHDGRRLPVLPGGP